MALSRLALWFRRVCFVPLWISIALASLVTAQLSTAAAIRSGFDTSGYDRNDDGSHPCTGLGVGPPAGCTPSTVPLGFTANFFGLTFSSVYVNNNGNVTFDSPLATFTPFGLTSTSRQIIAPFFADVDTRFAGSTVTFGGGTVGGRTAFGVNWRDVDYFASSTSHTNRNSFQLVLIDRADTGTGNFDVEFNYDQILWEAGTASGGDLQGRGGSSARAGFSNGSGSPGTSLELAGSGVNGAFLDSSPTGLIHDGSASDELGRYVFRARNSGVTTGDPLLLPEQTVSSAIRGTGDFAWTSRYRMSLSDGAVRINENIRLVGDDPGEALRRTWEDGVERVWSNRFDVVDDQGFRYPILLDVSFVAAGGDQIVTVHTGTGRTNMAEWFTDRPGGWPNERHGTIAAHEVGHMLGLFDEYAGGALNPNIDPNIFTNSIMADLGPPNDRHFQEILNQLMNRTDRGLSLAPSPLAEPWTTELLPEFGATHDPPTVAAIPAPSVMLLVLTGFALCAFFRARMPELSAVKRK